MAISGALIQKILPILINHLRDENECKTYLVWALGTKETISSRVAWHTSKNIFITDMVMKLDAFGITDSGESSIGIFLLEIRKNVGIDIQTKIDGLLQEISVEKQEQQEEQTRGASRFCKCPNKCKIVKINKSVKKSREKEP